MTKVFYVLILFFSLPAVLSADETASETEQAADDGWREIQLPFQYQNVQVPREFWDFAKAKLLDEGAAQKTIDEFAVLPVTVKVEISTDDSRVVRDHSNYRLIIPEGGGEVDMFNYIIGKGEFFVRLSPFLNNDHPFHLFYISDSPGKKIAGDLWGNGCGKIFDLTVHAGKFLLDRGMKVTASRKQYMHFLAGTYVFFQLVEERLYLGYIRLTDSRYPQFKCRES